MPIMTPSDTAMILASLGSPPSSYLVQENFRESEADKTWREARKTLRELDPRQHTWRVLIEWLKLA